MNGYIRPVGLLGVALLYIGFDAGGVSWADSFWGRCCSSDCWPLAFHTARWMYGRTATGRPDVIQACIYWVTSWPSPGSLALGGFFRMRASSFSCSSALGILGRRILNGGAFQKATWLGERSHWA